ncbi:MAG: hypothetical protein K9M51_03270 [Candidatus Gracilibacteria bacterium]|nr:hypothetical protein [Candidatus Gracilibacteria bacterium]
MKKDPLLFFTEEKELLRYIDQDDRLRQKLDGIIASVNRHREGGANRSKIFDVLTGLLQTDHRVWERTDLTRSKLNEILSEFWDQPFLSLREKLRVKNTQWTPRGLLREKTRAGVITILFGEE